VVNTTADDDGATRLGPSSPRDPTDGDPQRLASSDAHRSELAEPFSVSIQAVSKHLKGPRGRRPDHARPTGQLRPSRIDGAPLKGSGRLIGDYQPLLGARLRAQWTSA